MLDLHDVRLVAIQGFAQGAAHGLVCMAAHPGGQIDVAIPSGIFAPYERDAVQAVEVREAPRIVQRSFIAQQDDVMVAAYDAKERFDASRATVSRGIDAKRRHYEQAGSGPARPQRETEGRRHVDCPASRVRQYRRQRPSPAPRLAPLPEDAKRDARGGKLALRTIVEIAYAPEQPGGTIARHCIACIEQYPVAFTTRSISLAG